MVDKPRIEGLIDELLEGKEFKPPVTRPKSIFPLPNKSAKPGTVERAMKEHGRARLSEAKDFRHVSMRRVDGAIKEIRFNVERMQEIMDTLLDKERDTDGVLSDSELPEEFYYHLDQIEMMVGRMKKQN